MTNTAFIAQKTALAEKNISTVLLLLSEDCTIPFIARYRKDRTGNLNEEQIEAIAKAHESFITIEKRKESILQSIEEQNALTEPLKDKILQSFDLVELEDLYLPYKKKRKTKADTARALGLEPLAKLIMSQRVENLDFTAKKYLSNEVSSIENALQGARDIIAEWINENTWVRKAIRRKFQREAVIATKVVKGKNEDENAQKYNQYFDWSEPLYKMPSHRLLAVLRAENEGFIKFSATIDKKDALQIIEKSVIKNPDNEAVIHIEKAIADSYKRLIEPSISNEVLLEYKTKADVNSIEVFSKNLSQLLLGAPLGEKRILAIDPGFKTGCKVVCIDENGNLLHNETIFPHPPQKEIGLASKKMRSLVNAHKIDAIAIGNGTASRETEQFIKNTAFDRKVQVFVVNEAGASIYSASKIAREEFPNYDITVRGAVSIGRRLQDPLAELVKIDPKSIGVGQYQHDVDQNLLKKELELVVEKCVNRVGVNLNTASKELLKYVSGIGEKMAENIVKYRTENGAFTSRDALKKVPRLGEKAYQQSVAFLRILDSDNPLDNSAIHPEVFSVVSKIAKDLQVPINSLIGNETLINQISIEKYTDENIGKLYITDVLNELKKPGIDPRKVAKVLEFDPTLKTIDDVVIGRVYNGIVNNITNFGCFVDIGIKENGLVHISQIKEGYISQVADHVQLHQHVQVKVVAIDKVQKKIQLSMIL